VLSVCTPLREVAGVENVTLSLPHLLGGSGVLGTIPLPLSEAEQSALHESAKTIKSAIDSLRLD
jgi:L-lactate dehydrogenase